MSIKKVHFKPEILDKDSIREFYDGASDEILFSEAMICLVTLCPPDQYGEDDFASGLQDLIGELYWRIKEK